MGPKDSIVSRHAGGRLGYGRIKTADGAKKEGSEGGRKRAMNGS